MKVIAKNPNSRRNYEITETYVAGVVLVGSEVKSIRKGEINLKDTYCIIKNNEVWLLNMYVKPYDKRVDSDINPYRSRKLLLNKLEIKKIKQKVQEKKLSLIPITLLMDNHLVKVEIGLGKGKKLYDKREDLAKKSDQRKIERALKKSLNKNKE